MPSSERIVLIAAVGVVALFVVYAVYTVSTVPGTVTTPVPSSFTVNGRSYTFTYIATTEAEREAGLMNKQVTNATTMLFAFPYFGAWTFYMKDTNTSLDIIWINATGNTGRVVSLASGTQPYSTADIVPTGQANYVIETRAGFAAANGITVGTTIGFA